jgi:hypothetical protein
MERKSGLSAMIFHSGKRHRNIVMEEIGGNEEIEEDIIF